MTLRAPGETVVPEGTTVTDRTGHLRGRIVRVFGPVSRPYLSVRLRRLPTPEVAAALVGQVLLSGEE